MPTFEEIDASHGWDSPYNTTGSTTPSLSTTVAQPTNTTNTTPWASNPTTIAGQTAFPDVDMNTGKLLSGSSGSGSTYTPTTTLLGNQPYQPPGASSSSSSLSYTVAPPNQPTAPTNPPAPGYNSTLGDMYTRTFTDPNSMWNEYNQGQGVAFTQGAARAMAKAGRTGMLPALTSLAHQDYMSNYLPSVRKDLAPGLNYENTWNQNLTQKYGQDQDFLQKGFGTEASMYGQGLTYSSNMAQVAAQIKDIGVKQELGMLDNLMKQYGIDNDTQQQIYASMATMFPKMSAADQSALVNELYLAMGVNKAGNQTLADLTNPVGSPTTTTTGTTTNNSIAPWADVYGG